MTLILYSSDPILSHGVIGAFFTGDPSARIYPSDFSKLAQQMTEGKIDIAKGAEIRLFACNQASNAQHLSKELADRGRGDIKVTGSKGSVSPN